MGSVQQHLFGPTPDSEQSQWFTPDWLAERTVEWVGLHSGARVIELGAGDGSFVRPLLARGHDVVAVERDPRFAAILRRNFPAAHVNEMDALAPEVLLLDPFDAYIGNPPYEDDADIAFVERGFELAPRVIVVLRLVFLAGQERWRRIWTHHHLGRIAYLPERPAFIGESSGGAKADFAVLDIRRGPARPGHRVETEWWVRVVDKFPAHAASEE